MPSGTSTALLLIAASAVVSSLPVLISGLPRAGHDSTFHVIAFSHFAAQFFDGEAYPRWLIAMNAGYGSPMFFYYPPLPYYVAAVSSLLTPWTADPWLEMGFSILIALALSGILFFLWIRQEVSPASALAASLIYMIAPYHLAVDTYLRAAVGELWAFAWMPLLLIAIRRCARDAAGALWVAGAVALLLLSHLPTTLLLVPVAAAYGTMVAWRARSARTLLLAPAGALLGAAMAAVYLLPALALRHAVDMDIMHSRDLNFRNWFILAHPVLYRFKGAITYFVLSTATLVVVAEAVARTRRDQRTVERRFWVVAAIISLLLMSGVARPFWERVTLLQEIQFPWRFGTLLTLAAAAVVGYATNLTGVTLRGALGTVRFGLVPVLLGSWIVLTVLEMRPREWPPYARHRYDYSLSAPEHRPHASLPLFANFDAHSDAAAVILRRGHGTLALASWRPRRIVLGINSPVATTVEVPQFNFPGWRAELADAHTAPIRTSAIGTILLDLPPGDHTITLKLMATPPEQRGRLLSAAGWTLWLLGCAAFLVRQRRRPPARARLQN